MAKLIEVSEKTIASAIDKSLKAASSSIELNIANSSFNHTIIESAKIIATSKNRVITTGMGKSGLIARKTAATLTSTGTAAVFLHPADALHGDVGNVRKKEVVLAFSNSGETRELIELLPHIKFLGGKLVAVTQNADSTLAKEADQAIIFSISKEGCPLNLAPMASTTISVIIGDAIAAALIKIKGFEKSDFGRFHPSGSLGKKILTRVSDLMLTNQKVFVTIDDTFEDILSSLVNSNMGAVLVVDKKNKLLGLITDGDIKRYLKTEKKSIDKFWQKSANDLMSKTPTVIKETSLMEEALALMKTKNIYILPVIDRDNNCIGVIRMHDIMGSKK